MGFCLCFERTKTKIKNVIKNVMAKIYGHVER